jgi:hypothetical protein
MIGRSPRGHRFAIFGGKVQHQPTSTIPIARTITVNPIAKRGKAKIRRPNSRKRANWSGLGAAEADSGYGIMISKPLGTATLMAAA